jgi:hypothetical protein
VGAIYSEERLEKGTAAGVLSAATTWLEDKVGCGRHRGDQGIGNLRADNYEGWELDGYTKMCSRDTPSMPSDSVGHLLAVADVG